MIDTGYSCKVRATWGRVGGWRSWTWYGALRGRGTCAVCRTHGRRDDDSTVWVGLPLRCRVSLVRRGSCARLRCGRVASGRRAVRVATADRRTEPHVCHDQALHGRLTGVSRASHGRLTGARRFTHRLQAGGFVTLIADRTLGRSGARRPRLALAGFRRAEGQSLAFCLRVACRQDWHRR